MFTPIIIRNPFRYLYEEVKYSILYKFYSKKWYPQYCTICCKMMDPTYILVFNVHLASKHSAQVKFHCPNGCKKIHGWAYKKEIFLKKYCYNIGEYKLIYYKPEEYEPKNIRLITGTTSSNIPFFDLEKMTRNGIIKRIDRLVPFL